jgi:YVTN family beta-propeller protein
VTATVPAGLGALSVAVNPVTNQTYVVNQNGNSVSVIDGASNATTTIAVGSGPTYVAVNPVTNKIYVSNTQGSSVTVIDGASNATTTIAVGSGPANIAVNPVTNQIYVSDTGGNAVTVIDGAGNTAISIPAGVSPAALAVNPDTNKIYVVNSGGGVTVIDGASNSTTTVATDRGPQAVAVNPVTGKIYVANAAGDITVIDGASNTTTSVPVSGIPTALAVNPVTNQIYVAGVANAGSGAVAGSVTVIDGASNTTTTVAVGYSPSAVTVDTATNQVYVVDTWGTSGSSGAVTVLDGATLATTAVPTGSQSQAVAVNPVTNKIYVSNSGDGTVSVLDGATNATTNVGTCCVPSAVAVNPVTNQIYVANFYGWATIIDGATNATTTVYTDQNSYAVAVNPVTNQIYVGNFYADDVTVIDGATLNTTTVPIGSGWYGAIAVNPITNQIYATNSWDNTVTVIDGASNGTTTLSVGADPISLDVNLVTNKIYTANFTDGTVTVIDGASNATTTVPVDSYPFAVAVNPVTNKIYTANNGANDVTVIDGASNATTNIPLPYGSRGPVNIAVNPVTNKIYVVNQETNNVNVIDGVTNTVIATAAAPGDSNSWGIAINPATNKIYVANWDSDTMTVIDGDTNAVISNITAGHLVIPYAVAVNPVTNRAYLANQNGGYVTVLTEEAAAPVPLVTTITPLPGNVTTEPTPVFSFTAESSFAPFAPAVEGVYYQVDTLQGPWLPASGTAPDFSGQLPILTRGSHVLYAWAGDGTDATDLAPGASAAGAIAAYPFTVVTPYATQVPPVLTLTCPAIVYDGYPHTCTGTAAGAEGVPVSGSWSFSPANVSAAGSHTVTGTFTSSDPTYGSGIATGTLTIAQATQSPAVSCYNGQYTGTGEGCAVTPQAGDINCSSGTVTTVSGGSVALSCGSDNDYLAWSGSGNVQISQATTAVTVVCNPSSATYNGEQPIQTSNYCKAKVTGAGGLNASLPVSPAQVDVTGPVSVSASYGGSQNYASASGSATLTVTQAAIDCSVKDSHGTLLSTGVQEQYGTVLTVTCTQPALSSLKDKVTGPGSYTVTGTDSATLTMTNGNGPVNLTLSETVSHVTSTWSFTVNAVPVPLTCTMPNLPVSAGMPYYQYTYGVSASNQTYPLPTLANGGIKLSSGALLSPDTLNVKVEMYNPNTSAALSLSGDPLTEAIPAGDQQYELAPVLPKTTKYAITFAPAPMYFVADFTAATIVEANPAKNVWGPVQNVAAGIRALSQYSFKVTNKSGADVGWTITGSDTTNFTISQSSCTTYRLASPAATTCTITVTFAPSNPLVVGSYTDRITITGVDQSTGAAVFNTLVLPAVTDTLNAYVYNENGLTVAPNPGSFTVTGESVQFTVTNNSGYPVTLAATKFSKATQFAVVANNSTCLTTTPLPAGAGNICTLTVKYTAPARNAPAATADYANMTVDGTIAPVGGTITLAKQVVEFNLD